MKLTKNRQRIYETIFNSKVPLTAYDISSLLKNISLTTVYRALDYLQKEGRIKYIVINDFKYYYSTEVHQHFFQCIKCKKLFTLNACFIQPYEQYIENNVGFKITEHLVFFSGICKNCQREEQK